MLQLQWSRLGSAGGHTPREATKLSLSLVGQRSRVAGDERLPKKKKTVAIFKITSFHALWGTNVPGPAPKMATNPNKAILIMVQSHPAYSAGHTITTCRSRLSPSSFPSRLHALHLQMDTTAQRPLTSPAPSYLAYKKVCVTL